MVDFRDAFSVSLAPDLPNLGGDGELPAEFRDDTLRDFAAFGFDPDEIELRVGTAGYGAEGFVLFSVFTGLTALFLSGKKIDENLDAWVRLGRRFRALLAQTNKRVRPVAISQPVALALTLARLSYKAHDLDGSSVLAAHVIPVRNGSLAPTLEGRFESQPDRFYLFLLRLPNDDTSVIGMRSDGTVLFDHSVPTGDFLRYFDITGDNHP
jgi:hypothetical protein